MILHIHTRQRMKHGVDMILDIDPHRLSILEQYAALAKAPSSVLFDFAKYVPRENLARFLVKYEIFKHALGIQGSVVECGVYTGAGLITFAQFSEILEPLNHQRKIIGFDTWSGFTGISDVDRSAEEGNFAADLEELRRAVSIFESTRYLKHIPKIELVQGDIRETVPYYLDSNPHLIVSLLYLDVDLFLPTKIALERFLPRMPKGAVIVFDQLNSKDWPGETIAMLDVLDNPRIQRSIATSISYVILE